MRFVPYEQSRHEPNIVVDGSPNEATVLTLTHWPGIAQPARLADDLVPVDNAVLTAELLTSSEVTTEFVERAGHNDLLLVDPHRYITAIARLIESTQG